MQQETLAQLICRTVLEFEQRQVTHLQQGKVLERTLNSSNINASSQPTSNESKSKRPNCKKKTA
jgi:hypothetical protein